MSAYMQQLGSALNQPSMQQLMQGSGQAGQALTPQMQQAATANPMVSPQMLQGATVAGAQPNAPAMGGTPGMSSQDALMTMMGNNLQAQNTLAPISALGQVGQEFINKNVMQKQLMPAPGNFGMASSTMGPLQFGSSQSPLLAYLSMLGAKG